MNRQTPTLPLGQLSRRLAGLLETATGGRAVRSTRPLGRARIPSCLSIRRKASSRPAPTLIASPTEATLSGGGPLRPNKHCARFAVRPASNGGNCSNQPGVIQGCRLSQILVREALQNYGSASVG